MIGSGDYISREAALDVNVKDYPPYLDYPKPRKPQTNADKLRSMSDEELAEWLDNLVDHCNEGPCFNCFLKDACLNGKMLDWLKEASDA